MEEKQITPDGWPGYLRVSFVLQHGPWLVVPDTAPQAAGDGFAANLDWLAAFSGWDMMW